MGATLLINGQPLQVGQTGTITFFVSTICCPSYYVNSPIIGPFFTVSSSIENLAPIITTNIRGTIYISVFNVDPIYNANFYATIYYAYVTPSTIYYANNYIIWNSMYVGFATVGPGRTYVFSATISISNCAVMYIKVNGDRNRRALWVNGTLIYTISGSL
jgi:hypothetical protein